MMTYRNSELIDSVSNNFPVILLKYEIDCNCSLPPFCPTLPCQVASSILFDEPIIIQKACETVTAELLLMIGDVKG
jgi:hypothetical protein